MSLLIPNVLSEEALGQFTAHATQLAWRDGRDSAGMYAKPAKNNEQADLTVRSASAAKALLTQALSSNSALQSAAWPKVMSNLIISRTRAGGGYDWHSDDALMTSGAKRLRTDLSFTLFLSDPADYDGGALEIHQDGSVESHKHAAGDLVLYPSGTLHRVAPVTRGTRIVCVGWVESLLRRPHHREVLFDLLSLRDTLSKTHDTMSPEILTLSKTISNLLRQWSEK